MMRTEWKVGCGRSMLMPIAARRSLGNSLPYGDVRSAPSAHNSAWFRILQSGVRVPYTGSARRKLISAHSGHHGRSVAVVTHLDVDEPVILKS
jgi:hypothetical protein